MTLAVLGLGVLPGAAQEQQIGVDIYGNQAAATIPIAVPFPSLAAGVAPETIREPFFSPLTRDLAFSDIFSLVALPANVAPSADVAKKAGARAYLRLDFRQEGADYLVEA